MDKPKITESGTYSLDDIEYNEYPPPSYLLKAMEKKWAEKLIESGEIKLNSLQYLRSFEDSEIGDRYEGKGEVMLNSKPMHSGTINKVYVWSCSLPTTNHDELLEIKKEYDTIICVTDPVALAGRCFEKLYDKYGFFLTHLGIVQYDRGRSVSKNELNNQKWLHNVFQKRNIYKHQNEYRMAFTDLKFKMKDEYITLEVGSCEDIIKVEYEV